MSLGVLNNISATYAQTYLNQSQQSLQKTLSQLSSGSRINTGADDAAGLALADGLHANVAALSQSSLNAQAGVGLLQTADGALSQVTSLLDRAITLATEASNGTLNTNQSTSADKEFQNIVTEINNIGTKTNYNGNALFSGTAVNLYVSDGTSGGSTTFAVTVGALTNASIGTATTPTDLSSSDLTTAAKAQAALTKLTDAVNGVALQRGNLGASMNQLSAAANVANTQSVNLQDAENNIRATNYGQATSDMAKYKVLSQTGIAALAQANAVQQDVLKLLQ